MMNTRFFIRIWVPALAFSLATCSGRQGKGRLPQQPTLFPLVPSWYLPLEGPLAGPLTTDGSRLFFVTRPGGLQAVEAATGNDLWRLPDRLGLPAAAPGWLGVRDADGSFSAHDPETGAVRWTVASGVEGDLPPTLGSDVAVVAGHGLAVLEQATGRVRWSAETEATTPAVVHGDSVLVGQTDGTLRCWSLGTGAPRWSSSPGRGPLSPPVIDEKGRLFLGSADRRLVSLDVAKGAKRWSWKVGTETAFQAAVGADNVLFATSEAVLYAFRGGNGHLAWRAPLPSRPLSGPLLAAGAVLIACNGTRPSESLLLGFELTTGRRLGELKTGGEIQGSPILVGDKVIVQLRHPKALRALSSHP
jgi:outer membrane protein assembly factor BamB